MSALVARKSSALPLRRRIVWTQIAFFGAIHVLALSAVFFPSWEGLTLAVVMHAMTGGLGISVGYHRLLTHRSFRTTRVVRGALAFLGALALQGGPLRWAAMHRAHHRFTDRVGDPHARANGFWWSHCGWIFFKAPNGFRFRQIERQVPDLAGDSILKFIENHYLSLNVASWALIALTLGWQIALWAVFLRIVMVWHATWLVNSWCHVRVSESGVEESSRNNLVVSYLTYGEGLHLNHHRNPAEARFGRLIEGDLAGALIPLLATNAKKR